jgi:two-component system phosphate regulon sensor histidine kinase PhoR
VLRKNCWDIKRCGRGPGGANVATLGACPAGEPGPHSGLNGGVEGGRICWAVVGTLCDGEVQGSFATKQTTCTQCEVFKGVQAEEGSGFRLLVPGGVHHALHEQFVAITSIVNSMNAVVYVADLETHELLFLNPYGEKLFGTNVLGRPCYEVLQAGQKARCAFCTNDRLIVNGEPGPPVVWEFQNTVTRRWFQCIDRAIRWWDGRLVRMEVAFDITEHKEADRFREQYVGLVMHDLRNPLNALLLNAQALKHSAKKAGIADECTELDHVIASAVRMNAMIGDLLETTRLESGRLEMSLDSIDLAAWVNEVVDEARAPKTRARVAVHPASSPIHVMADRNRLERVLDNLLANALKYSGDALIEISVLTEGDEAIVSVRDHGKGVTPEDAPHVFDRFFRGAQEGHGKGLGLGLYNARLIIEAHGGHIWVESPPDGGADFRFALPRG